jgi:hypothetical protein
MAQSGLSQVDLMTFVPITLQLEPGKPPVKACVNLCFATKISLLVTFLGSYGAYYLSYVIEREKNNLRS